MTKGHKAAVDVFLRLAGIDFESSELLERALRHGSFVHEESGGTEGSNEELEFLGDAVLGFFVVERLYGVSQQRKLNVGTVAKIKSWVVSKQVLAECAQGLKLAECVLLGQGEHICGGRRREALLADTLEAVVGAYYLDRGAEKARVFVLKLLEPYMEQAFSSNHCSDYKSLLQCHVQKFFGELPHYQVLPDPAGQGCFTADVSFGQRCWGSGGGRSKKQAEKAAAQRACEELGVVDENP